MDQDRTILEPEAPERDRFIEAVERFAEFARERAVPLTFAGIAATLLVVVGVWFVNQRATADVDAYVALYAATQTIDEASVAGGTIEDPTELTNAVAQLAGIAEGPQSSRAQIVEARAAILQGDNQRAAQLYQRAANPANGPTGLFAQLSYGVALERDGDFAGALLALDTSALEPYRSTPGYDVALAESTLARARVARLDGKPQVARDANQSLVNLYEKNREAAIRENAQRLATKASAFLLAHEASATGSDVKSLYATLDAWIQQSLSKPESERTGLQDGLRIQRELEEHLSSLARAKRQIAEGNESSALFTHASAAGDVQFSPSQTQYQRAILELARLDQMLAE